MRLEQRHDSMRGWFVYELYHQMRQNKDIILVVGDLGYGVWDHVRDDMPEQFINTGAAEQAMMGIAVGLALSGKIPFVYSISSFLIYRPFETIRNYVNHEKIPVRLIGSGTDKDYAHDGFSHWMEDMKPTLDLFGNIKQHWPQTKEIIPNSVAYMVANNTPQYIGLKR